MIFFTVSNYFIIILLLFSLWFLKKKFFNENLYKKIKEIKKLFEEIKYMEKIRLNGKNSSNKSYQRKISGKEWVDINKAAEMLCVNKEIIRRAIKSGNLKAFQINKNGTWKVSREELDRFVEGKSFNLIRSEKELGESGMQRKQRKFFEYFNRIAKKKGKVMFSEIIGSKVLEGGTREYEGVLENLLNAGAIELKNPNVSIKGNREYYLC